MTSPKPLVSEAVPAGTSPYAPKPVSIEGASGGGGEGLTTYASMAEVDAVSEHEVGYYAGTMDEFISSAAADPIEAVISTSVYTQGGTEYVIQFADAGFDILRRILVGGVAVIDWSNAAVPSVASTGNSWVYITGSAGGDTVVHWAEPATAGTIPVRDSGGRLYVAEPTLDEHAATKNYVDEAIAAAIAALP